MKKLIVALLIVLVIYSPMNAQRKDRDLKPLQKIEQLEKAKLIEALSLSEDTAVRFFARRNDSQQKVREIIKQRDALIKDLEKNLKDGVQMSDNDYKDKVNSIMSLDASMAKQREIFYRSLDDLFTPQQIAKLVVFESNFRKEIRESLMFKGRMQKN